MIALHNANHLPFRDWCKHCLSGKAPDWPHQSRDKDDDALPEVQMDYSFLNRAGDSDLLTVLSAFDCMSGA